MFLSAYVINSQNDPLSFPRKHTFFNKLHFQVIKIVIAAKPVYQPVPGLNELTEKFT